MTVGKLLDDWEAKALPNRPLEPATIARHRASMRVLRADLGSKRLKSLTPDDVETALQRRAANGYSKASCHKLRTTLGLALTWAERRGHDARNVASVVEIPTNARAAASGKSMTATETARFLDAASDTPLEAMWITMLHLGLRPGEAAGLSWDDID
jgi:integrase